MKIQELAKQFLTLSQSMQVSAEYFDNLGKVLKVGPEVREIKKGEAIMIHEYGIKTMLHGRGFEEGEIYFIEEKNCVARVDDLKEEIPLTEQALDDKELERMRKL